MRVYPNIPLEPGYPSKQLVVLYPEGRYPEKLYLLLTLAEDALVHLRQARAAQGAADLFLQIRHGGVGAVLRAAVGSPMVREIDAVQRPESINRLSVFGFLMMCVVGKRKAFSLSKIHFLSYGKQGEIDDETTLFNQCSRLR